MRAEIVNNIVTGGIVANLQKKILGIEHQEVSKQEATPNNPRLCSDLDLVQEQ